MLTDALSFSCPWCNEVNAVEYEPGDAGQWLIQDCAVCCNPIEIKLPLTENDRLAVRREG
ncbi:MAG: CPXCG motif-containing cysteine-rich protein [Pseudomonadota bacterium]